MVPFGTSKRDGLLGAALSCLSDNERTSPSLLSKPCSNNSSERAGQPFAKALSLLLLFLLLLDPSLLPPCYPHRTIPFSGGAVSLSFLLGVGGGVSNGGGGEGGEKPRCCYPSPFSLDGGGGMGWNERHEEGEGEGEGDGRTLSSIYVGRPRSREKSTEKEPFTFRQPL